MRIIWKSEGCYCGPTLSDLEPGDMFELVGAEDSTVYMVVQHHMDAVTRVRGGPGAGISHHRRAERMMKERLYIDLSSNQLMPIRRWKGSTRVRKLCVELNVSRDQS